MPEYNVKLDVTNENCPQPVMKTKGVLKEMQSGDVLYVMATDSSSKQDIEILLDATHDELVQSNFEQGIYHFYIKKS